MSRNFLSTNQELHKGDFLLSNNREYKATFQDDGNFVIYKWAPVWSTSTANSEAFRVLQQEDTNLVIYTENDVAVWRSGSYTRTANERVRLTLTNDGHLVTHKNGEQVWSSEES